jgi:mersacidin/lichenicidin family type 2 lantibiotic
MKQQDIIRAWKDEAYRNSLSAEERALLPENPAGSIDLSDEDLQGITGGKGGTNPLFTAGCCQTYNTCDFVKCASTIVIGPLCSA